MASALRHAAWLAALALSASTAGAEPTPELPKLTKDFIAGCAASSKNCGNWIAMVSMEVTYEAISKGEPPTVCTSAFKHVRDASRQQIVASLKSQPELHEAETSSAVAPLIKQFRPETPACRDALDDGLPTTTAAFLAHCATEAPDAIPTCDSVIDSVAATAIMRGQVKVCFPKRAADQPAPNYAANVRKWMVENAAGADPSRNATIAAGYGALYGCAK